MTTDTDLIRENNQEGLQVGDFKVGDRVRVVNPGDGYFCDEGKVIDFDDSRVMSIGVYLDGLIVRFAAEELELVTAPGFKVGDRA